MGTARVLGRYVVDCNVRIIMWMMENSNSRKEPDVRVTLSVQASFLRVLFQLVHVVPASLEGASLMRAGRAATGRGLAYSTGLGPAT